MSLKIPRVGKSLTQFEFSVAKSNEDSILITVLYGDNKIYDKSIVFHVFINHGLDPDLLCKNVYDFIEKALNVVDEERGIYYDIKKKYIKFTGNPESNKEYKYLVLDSFNGWYYRGNIYD